MKPTTDVWAWLAESYQRMGAKSPKFFQVVQAIGMIAMLISGIPLALQQAEMFLGLKINLPEVVNSDLIRIVFWCGMITKIIGKLPVADSVKKELTVSEKKEVLPFTTKKEK